jgi:transformation/transcription domain-associated protein
MSLYDLDPRLNEQNDIVDWFGHALLELNPNVFQEVWTHKIELFFENAQRRPILLNVCQFLFSRDPTTAGLLSIVLKFLIERLPQLGECDEHTGLATIRLYKMAFHAVSLFPPLNEPILASHLAKLLMDCFPLAAKASKPAHYFHLLRALFRAIGVGGGRFELLYNAVLPLLPEMLESLNRQLLASSGSTRDMIVDLCLTVPLRLTHLLPHLSYLMQPLALALRGNPDLASQGLRTLELCIDNLTPDFLDPTLSIVLRELMEALFSHLKPAPQSHNLAHTTIRILGKLGGRNRRLLFKEPALAYHHHSEPAKMAISFNGKSEAIVLGPVADLAVRMLPKLGTVDQLHAYRYLENCASLMLYEVCVRGLT